MADFTQSNWPVHIGRLTPEQRREAMQDLGRGVHRIVDEAGKAIDLSPPSDHCGTAAPPPTFERRVHTSLYEVHDPSSEVVWINGVRIGPPIPFRQDGA